MGPEAYTIAMVLADLAPRLGRFAFAILGTDICTTVLEQARHAIYPAEMMSPVPEDYRRRFVMRAREPRGHRSASASFPNCAPAPASSR